MAADKASREVEGLAMKSIAGKLGKQVEALNKKDFELKRLKTFARLLKNDIMSGVKAFDSKEQCEAAFRKIVDDFVKERFDVMDEIDRQDPVDRSGSVAVRREPQQACAGRVQMKERRPAETAGLLCADERPVTSRRLLVRRRVRLSRSRPARTSRRRCGRNACRNDGRGA